MNQVIRQQLALSWDPSPGGNAAGYLISYGTASHSYSWRVDAGNQTVHTVSDLADGTTYYFAVQAYDSAGALSAYSSEVIGRTPGTALTASPQLPILPPRQPALLNPRRQ
ncbi:MAG TPA: fibronectin type III domain-containing protein [Vicinamibacterales bacterium]|nr:fibronectin type III domain-containing protein [Vicinamibacterales bacterium]